MNIRHGIFRIWVVLSILWVVAVIYEGYQKTTYLNPDFEEIMKTSKENKLAAESSQDMTPEELDALAAKFGGKRITPQDEELFKAAKVSPSTVGVIMPDGITVKNVPSNTDKPQFLKAYTTWKRDHTWSIVYETIVNAMTLPVITLIIWFTIIWIRAGFRSKAHQQ